MFLFIFAAKRDADCSYAFVRDVDSGDGMWVPIVFFCYMDNIFPPVWLCGCGMGWWVGWLVAWLVCWLVGWYD